MEAMKSNGKHKDVPTATDDPVSPHLCSRLRDLRHKRNWTLEETSAACGVSRSMLSEIERGRANPTLAVAWRIAQAFGLSLGQLVETPAASSPQIDVIRADDRTYHFRNDRHCRIRTLSPLHLEKSVEYYEITLQPKSSLRSSPHFKGARELLTVQKGAVKVTSADDTVDLQTGDSAHYPADVPHSIQNTSPQESTLFLVVTYMPD